MRSSPRRRSDDRHHREPQFLDDARTSSASVAKTMIVFELAFKFASKAITALGLFAENWISSKVVIPAALRASLMRQRVADKGVGRGIDQESRRLARLDVGVVTTPQCRCHELLGRDFKWLGRHHNDRGGRGLDRKATWIDFNLSCPSRLPWIRRGFFPSRHTPPTTTDTPRLWASSIARSKAQGRPAWTDSTRTTCGSCVRASRTRSACVDGGSAGGEPKAGISFFPARLAIERRISTPRIHRAVMVRARPRSTSPPPGPCPRQPRSVAIGHDGGHRIGGVNAKPFRWRRNERKRVAPTRVEHHHD